MIEYDLTLCYGIIISVDRMEEIKEVLTDEEYDELIDNYSRCVNNWTGEDYFIGIMRGLPNSAIDNVYYASKFSIPTVDEEKNFKRFFGEHNLWKFISWEPKLLLINFCY